MQDKLAAMAQSQRGHSGAQLFSDTLNQDEEK